MCVGGHGWILEECGEAILIMGALLQTIGEGTHAEMLTQAI